MVAKFLGTNISFNKMVAKFFGTNISFNKMAAKFLGTNISFKINILIFNYLVNFNRKKY